MNEITPILGPIKLLLRSRKVMVAASGTISAGIVTLVVHYIPSLAPVRDNLYLFLGVVTSMLIAAIAYEDANTPFVPATTEELEPYEDTFDD